MRFSGLAGVLSVSLVVLAPSAWMSDDAYITLRTVDHFCEGRGLIYNPGERVQAYTHPLWMFALASVYCVTGAHYWGSLALALSCSLLAIVGFVRWHGRHAGVAAALVLALLGSRSFVDFSSSGLENPLTHVLVLLFYATYYRRPEREPARWLLSLTLTTSALMLCRMDCFLLVLPALLAAAWQVHRARGAAAFGALALGMAPWLAWESFSLVYYGAVIPNTALAKLRVGLPRLTLVKQGFIYLLDGVGRDPWTILVMAAGVLLSLLKPAPDTRKLALGIVLYLAYVVFIGGDYMSGRFFSAPLLLSCVILSRLLPPTSRVAGALGLAVALGACLAVRPTWSLEFDARPSRFGSAWDDASGVVDEQTFWYPGTGILNARTLGADMPASKGRAQAERSTPGTMLEAGTAGMTGFFAQPSVHIREPFALVDAFLARLPARREFRPGHFERVPPEGYVETLVSGQNQLKDPRLRRIYDDVATVTRGPLFRADRLRAMWRLLAPEY